MVSREIRVLLVLLVTYFSFHFLIYRNIQYTLYSAFHFGAILTFAIVIYRIFRAHLELEKLDLRNFIYMYLFIFVLFLMTVAFNLFTNGALLPSKSLTLFGVFTIVFFLFFVLGKILRIEKHRDFSSIFFVKYILLVTIVFLFLAFLILLLRNLGVVR
jgi:hypothetical protein